MHDCLWLWNDQLSQWEQVGNKGWQLERERRGRKAAKTWLRDLKGTLASSGHKVVLGALSVGAPDGPPL